MLVIKVLVGLHRAIQLQLFHHYCLGHRLGLPCYWMVCLGNEQRSLCHFWDCIQVLHFGELYHKEGWTPKNWCFWTVVLEKTLENSLDCKEMKPVNSKGNQPWIFIWRTDAEDETPILGHMMQRAYSRKDPKAGKDWREEDKGMIEDAMVGWHHWLRRVYTC